MIGETLLVIAAVIWIFDVLPQLVKTYKRKSAEELSYLMFGLGAVAYILFEAGNFLAGNLLLFWIYLTPAAITLLLFILMLKYRKG